VTAVTVAVATRVRPGRRGTAEVVSVVFAAGGARGSGFAEAAFGAEPPAGVLLDRHLAAVAGDPAPWPQLADVLVGERLPYGSVRDAVRALDRSRRDCPGALVTAVPWGARHCAFRLGTGALLLAQVRDRRTPGPWPALASLLHAWSVAGLLSAPTEVRWVPASGGAGSTARIRAVAPPPQPGGSSRSSRCRSESGGWRDSACHSRTASA